MRMYELTGNYNKVMAMLEDESTDKEALLGTLESIECAIEVKAENSVHLIKNLEAYSEGLRSEMERLNAKYDAVNNKTTAIKEYLFKQLENANMTEVRTNIATIKQQKNPASVVIEDESKIPAAYQTVVPESYKIRKAEIAKVLKAGFEVPGATLQQSSRWVIK